ncbi:MAG: GYD domain-containing protein [Deltaproteobacteria bacterium]|nr:GYD domain-containing protein [Deltaproteobacteria bacterium]
MATFAMLTRLTPETLKSPADLKRLEKEVSERIRKECPLVKWLANYAILGPYDYLDIFEAPDEAEAAKVVVIIRSIGHAQTETWTALPWERFEHLLGAGAGMPSRARAVSARGESRVHRAV